MRCRRRHEDREEIGQVRHVQQQRCRRPTNKWIRRRPHFKTISFKFIDAAQHMTDSRHEQAKSRKERKQHTLTHTHGRTHYCNSMQRPTVGGVLVRDAANAILFLSIIKIYLLLHVWYQFNDSLCENERKRQNENSHVLSCVHFSNFDNRHTGTGGGGGGGRQKRGALTQWPRELADWVKFLFSHVRHWTDETIKTMKTKRHSAMSVHVRSCVSAEKYHTINSFNK